MEKPSLPKGTRDFGPATMAKRQFILDHIKKVFQKYGFLPMETPAMENLDTLTGKYGAEGDQLLFKVLDSGNYYEKMIDRILSPERFLRINNFLFDCLKYLCQKLNEELTDDEIRTSFDKVASSIEVNYPKSTTQTSTYVYLEGIEREILQDFITSRRFSLAAILINFFFKANIYRQNFNEKIDFHFNQFRNTTLNDEILSDLKKFILSEILMSYSSGETTKEISEKGLRYDLTVPFARYVVMNRHEITLPFKRYQIQPVWRADRPQKGRYREFYQCDADVVGTDSLICEAEIILMIKEAFRALAINGYSIRINHREVLGGIAEHLGVGGKESDLFVALDKLEKVGKEKVRDELLLKGFTEKNIALIYEIFDTNRLRHKIRDDLDYFGKYSSRVSKGVQDILSIMDFLQACGDDTANVSFDPSLARGLSYYTGCIFEVKINNVAVGSVSGGGRYDNLTQAFGAKEQLSGVGISFGIDRIYDAMEELNIFPKETQVSSKVLVCHFDEESMRYGLKVLQSLRDNGIASEIYPDLTKKINKQLEYADKKMIPYSIVIGSEEMQSGLLAFKHMKSGEQSKSKLSDIVSLLVER